MGVCSNRTQRLSSSTGGKKVGNCGRAARGWEPQPLACKAPAFNISSPPGYAPSTPQSPSF